MKIQYNQGLEFYLSDSSVSRMHINPVLSASFTAVFSKYITGVSQRRDCGPLTTASFSMEHVDVHQVVEIAQQSAPVAAVHFVCHLNALRLPVGPVDGVLVQSQAERVRQIGRYQDLSGSIDKDLTSMTLNDITAMLTIHFYDNTIDMHNYQLTHSFNNSFAQTITNSVTHSHTNSLTY